MQRTVAILLYSGVDGGIETVVKCQIQVLNELGYKTVVISVGEERDISRLGISKVLSIPFSEEFIPLIFDRPFYFYKARKEINCAQEKFAEIIEENSIDLVHTHRPGFGLLLGNIKIPFITGIHSIPLSGDFKSYVRNRFATCVMNKSSHVYAVAGVALEGYKKYLKVPHSIIYNGMPVFEDTEKAKDDTVVIGTIGRMRPAKGFHILLDSFKLLIDEEYSIKLIIAGSPADEEQEQYFKELQRKVEEYGLEGKVELPGFMKPVEYLKKIDIACNPSYPHKEVCSMVILEAFAAGKPIVASNLGGNPEIIDNGRTGFLVKANDAKALSLGLKQLIDNDYLCNKIADEAKKDFNTRFELSVWKNTHKALYEKLLTN